MAAKTRSHEPPLVRDADWRTPVAIVAVATALALFAFQIGNLFMLLPVVWPDESVLAQPATLLLREGRLATPLLTGAASGVADRTYWYPQGYMLLLAAVFKAVGPTLEAMRAVSVAAAMIVLPATYAMARVSGASRIVALGATALLALDPVFVRASLVGRPDMVALALILLSLWLGAARGGWELVGGLCAGCAALVQPYGAIALVILVGRTVIERRPWLAIAVAGLPLLAWAVYGAQDVPALIDQVRLTLARHARPWSPPMVTLVIVDQYVGPLSWIVPIAWVAGAVGTVLTARADRRASPLLAAFALACLTTVSLQMWHPVYALPFVYIGIAWLLARLFTARAIPPATGRGWRRALAVTAAVGVTAGVLTVDVQQLGERARIVSTVRPTAYADWVGSIGRLLPDGSRVLLIGIPDPTWGLLVRDLALIAIQNEPRSNAHYRDRLDAEIDYIVVAGRPSGGWTEIVAPERAMLIGRIVVDTGQHDLDCPDWEPCGPLEASVYRVARHGRP